MFNERKKLFTIGQFAKIHKITKKTLMWYDEIDLFKPSVIGDNGCRYYTYYQSSTLETILLLRELNVSTNDIKKFLSERSAVNMERILSEKITDLENTISNLKNIHKTLTYRHKDLTTLLNIDLSTIEVIEKKQSYLAIITTNNENSEEEIEKVIAETQKQKLSHLHDAAYGAMISVENLYNNNFNEYSALYVELSKPLIKEELHMQPAGKYLRAFCKGSWDNLPGRYREILDYAKKNNLVLKGYSYETGINESVIDNIDDYITQIEIPLSDIH